MDVIVDMLRALRSQYADAVRTGKIRLISQNMWRQIYDIPERELSNWMNNTRAEILNIFDEICSEAGLSQLHYSHKLTNRFGRDF